MDDEKMEYAQQSADNKPKSKLLKLLVLILIIIAVSGIFIFKKMSTNSLEAPSGGKASTNGIDYSSPEFALESTESFDIEEILSYGLPVIIDFGADSCIPCKQMAPVLKELNQELRGKAIVKFVDVWKNPQAGQVMPLRAIPTQFFFTADGSPYVPKDDEAAIEQGFLFYMNKETEEHVVTAHEGGMTKEAIVAVLTEMGMK